MLRWAVDGGRGGRFAVGRWVLEGCMNVWRWADGIAQDGAWCYPPVDVTIAGKGLCVWGGLSG